MPWLHDAKHQSEVNFLSSSPVYGQNFDNLTDNSAYTNAPCTVLEHIGKPNVLFFLSGSLTFWHK